MKEYTDVIWENEDIVILPEEVSLNDIIKIDRIFYKVFVTEGTRVRVTRASHREILKAHPHIAYKH